MRAYSHAQHRPQPNHQIVPMMVHALSNCPSPHSKVLTDHRDTPINNSIPASLDSINKIVNRLMTRYGPSQGRINFMLLPFFLRGLYNQT